MGKAMYKFTLLAAQYSGPGINVRKPFVTTLPEDSDRIHLFRNRSFKEEHVTGTGVPVGPAAAAGAKGAARDQTQFDGLDVLTEYGVPGNKVKLLKEGYGIPQDILDESESGDKDEVIQALVQIKGIKDATATKIYDAAVAYVDSLDDEPETDEEESGDDD